MRAFLACLGFVLSVSSVHGLLHTRSHPGQAAPSPPEKHVKLTSVQKEEAVEKSATATAILLTQEERSSLTHGGHFHLKGYAPEPGYYTGFVQNISRLGLPALKMADAGNGFRSPDPKYVGTSTSWPSLLAMAATWDEPLVERYAEAVGEEFRGKGANMILGPAINVHRVARNGRNHEYLSGEDPFLGSRLVRPYIRGVQSKGVVATIKHFAFNEQETDRYTESSNVDEKTAWELYYPPFQAAVEAGAGAVMCAYNKVNGTYACGNANLLQRDLRGKMGFKGMVISDWGATHDVDYIKAGLDQEMPDNRLQTDTLGSMSLANITALDEKGQLAATAAIGHVVETMYRFNLTENPGCVPPNCKTELASDQTSDAHRALAREAAATSAVLLQNNGILPLGNSTVKKIVILGSADSKETTKYFQTTGGSGLVAAKFHTAPLDALKKQAAKAGITIVDNIKDADAALVIAGTNSEEATDRASLSLDGDSDRIIAEASKKKPTVVLLMIPGAVLTPWRNSTSAILALFLGGEESGNAAASLLFGDVSPSGKLPIMLPASEADSIAPGKPFSKYGDKDAVPYSEGLLTSYRSPTFKAAFPFGHGLSYTNFSYDAPAMVPLASCGPSADGHALAFCVQVNVTNTGKHVGTEVVQAYLQTRSTRSNQRHGRPDKVLKGFIKTKPLKPGEKQQAYIALSSRDLSTYSSGNGWGPIYNRVTLHIGSSSADIRHEIMLQKGTISDERHKADTERNHHIRVSMLLFGIAERVLVGGVFLLFFIYGWSSDCCCVRISQMFGSLTGSARAAETQSVTSGL